MKKNLKYFVLIMVFMILATVATFARAHNETKETDFQAYKKVVQNTVNMVSNPEARKIAGSYGMNILNVTWEDTGRYKNSSVGPNISDMTIQVQVMDPKTEQSQLFCMPVIRFPNFSDKTCDVKLEDFNLLVGNEKGSKLKKINLRQFLAAPRKYLTNPDSWKGKNNSLLAERDTHVLVSAQACFLPIPQKGIAEFNPVLFNYQSYAKNPAVLTILVTREGTSTTVIDNKRDGFSAGGAWGQRLFFNQNGERASLTGKRMSDYKAEKPDKKEEGKDGSEKGEKKDEGLNMVLLIQVPLRQKVQPRRYTVPYETESMKMAAPPASSDIENAVIGHGKVEGPFTEIDDLEIERDPQFPVRVTVQFYKATSNGVVSEKDMAGIAAQINKVYADSDYVESLVTGGDTGRPTEYDGNKVEPPDWWEDFWTRHEKEFGTSQKETLEMLQKLLGPGWKRLEKEEIKKKIEDFRKEDKISLVVPAGMGFWSLPW
ncbi:MAG: hypothetical protein ACLFQV_13990 [Vulcanimicrobiota bacterium]